MEIKGQHLVVLTNGFVYVGDCTMNKTWLHIAKARNIRRFGTSKGLGELISGPTSKTELDFCGDVIAPLHAIVHLIRCTKTW